MKWRAMLLSGILAAGLAMAPRASAHPPPWAGKWKHQGAWDRGDSWDRGHWHRDRWNQNNWHHDEWAHGYRYNQPYYGNGYRPYYGGYRYDRRNDPGYAKLMDRMHYDRAKINEIAPTGRHRKALQWYKDDLRNAQNDLRNDYYAQR